MTRPGMRAGAPEPPPARPSAGAALGIEGIDVALGGRPVLVGVDLRVAAGELVGLIGPNGAGKTTLLRTVLGLVAPTSGVVTRGAAVTAYVPQRHEFAWDFPISVRGAVMSARTSGIGWLRGPRDADRRAVAAALERVGMGGLADRPVGELSGGQRQRVLIARALALAPDLLLLDEPFVGLDVPTLEYLTALVRELRDGGCAILMTTHDIAAAKATCDRLCLLNRSIVAEGSPAQLEDPAIWMRAFGLSTDGPPLEASPSTA